MGTRLMALSKTQNKRLGGILTVMFKEELPQDVEQQLVQEGFVEKNDSDIQLTDKGIDEKNRLCTLAGLNIKYSSERKKED
jgi:predicted transcriptional regulator